MPDVDQKLIDDFSLLISTVVPILSKKFLTFLFGGQIGTGPFLRDIGGKGIARTILALTFIALFNSSNVIVDIKLITIWLDLNFNVLIIFFPTIGVIHKKIQLHELTISWLFLAISTFLKVFESFFAIDLFLGDTKILLKDILDLQIPVITDEAILPEPINPNFIDC